MNIIRWDPFRELEEMQERLNNIFENPTREMQTNTPAMNVFEEGGNLNFELMLPNYKPDEVDIDVAKDRLTIHATHKEETENKTKKYYRREATESSFYRQVALPKNLNVDKAKATQKHGVLTVSIPMVELPKPKKLKIEAPKEK